MKRTAQDVLKNLTFITSIASTKMVGDEITIEEGTERVKSEIKEAQKALYEDLMAMLPEKSVNPDSEWNMPIEKMEARLAQYFGVDKEETNG